MQIRELSIPDAFEIVPQKHADDRGVFLEWYRADRIAEAVGHPLGLRQANTSVSKRGVVRGIHFADVPPGQAKYITAVRGSVMDYVVDLRVGSPRFGTWESIVLDDDRRNAVYIAEGLGHAFVALTEDATVSYLVSESFNPSAEHGITPLDPAIGLVFPPEAGELLLSPKDLEAPTLEAAVAAGSLPGWDHVRAYYATLRGAAS